MRNRAKQQPSKATAEREKAEKPSHSIRLVPVDPAVKLKVGEKVRVFSTGKNETGLAVPTVAIREDGQGTFVLRNTAPPSGTTTERVPVTIIRSGEGWSLIEAGGISAGDKVLVSA